jgi:hypothetical protein
MLTRPNKTYGSVNLRKLIPHGILQQEKFETIVNIDWNIFDCTVYFWNGVLEDNIVGISFFAPVSGTGNDEAPWYVQYLQRVDFEHSREDQRQYSEIKRVLYGH